MTKIWLFLRTTLESFSSWLQSTSYYSNAYSCTLRRKSTSTLPYLRSPSLWWAISWYCTTRSMKKMKKLHFGQFNPGPPSSYTWDYYSFWELFHRWHGLYASSSPAWKRWSPSWPCCLLGYLLLQMHLTPSKGSLSLQAVSSPERSHWIQIFIKSICKAMSTPYFSPFRWLLETSTFSKRIFTKRKTGLFSSFAPYST